MKERTSVNLKESANNAKKDAKGSTLELLQYAFTCSICNLRAVQFREKIGLNSHQRTYKHT